MDRKIDFEKVGDIADSCPRRPSLVGEARGVGLVAGLEVSPDKTRRALFDPSLGIAAEVARRAQTHGITRGIGDIVSLCPPLIIDEALIDKLMEGIERALDDAHVWARNGGLMA